MHEFNATFSDRFWVKVDMTDTCWNWTAYRNEKGYGYIGANGRAGKMVSAHRASWVLHFGDIPEGKMVLHKCDNPGCVRPDHLELGDHQKNMDQKVARGRATSRRAFLEKEVVLLRQANADGLSKLELSRRTGVDYNTLLRVLSSGYVGRDEITLETIMKEDT